MFFIYALHLGYQLMKTGSCKPVEAESVPDRVLLLGPSSYEDEACEAALRSVGWTHIHRVNLISGHQLSLAKRHVHVFTKLRVFDLPYRKIVFLDLDLHVQGDLRGLFDLPGPAGKIHFRVDMETEIKHGQTVDHNGELPLELWCPNAGVMRIDPDADAGKRRTQIRIMEQEILSFGRERQAGDLQATMLPEQDYLSKRIPGWRHIDRHFNLEIFEAHTAEEVSKASVLHFSCKGPCSQPTVWLDLDVHVHDSMALSWCKRNGYNLEKLDAYIAACQAWRDAFEGLRRESKTWPLYSKAKFDAAVYALVKHAPNERRYYIDSRPSCRECYGFCHELFEGAGKFSGWFYCKACWSSWTSQYH